MKEPQMSERLCRCDRRSMKHSHNLQNTNKKLTFLLNILCMFFKSFINDKEKYYIQKHDAAQLEVGCDESRA